MYIPVWLLVIGTIILLVYCVKQSKNMNGNPKPRFAYKLTISIRPNWRVIHEHIAGLYSDEDCEKLFKSKMKKRRSDRDLYGRCYEFTEYYDFASGLTARFQTVKNYHGDSTSTSEPVQEFGDSGYIFYSDDFLSDDTPQPSLDESDEEREKRESFFVEVGEDFIRHGILDEMDTDTEERYLFSFPLEQVVDFLFNIDHRLDSDGNSLILKWPDNIKAELDKLGVKYKYTCEYEPKEFDLEELDSVFCEKWGRPKVSLAGYRCTSVFYDKFGTQYCVGVQAFRPEDNSRVREN